jgi:hypothetical protein
VALGFGRTGSAGPVAAVEVGAVPIAAVRAAIGWIETQSPSQAIRIFA